ncbi:hypothetical protein J1614_008071 [Plenodomus biglobosus]|nr:hypothetical protein J1614_008071 [Plenodomus biglobosus]
MGNRIDAIDLTLTSSPEPEPEPEQRPAQQRPSQAQQDFKKESRSYSMGFRKPPQVGHPSSAGRSNIAQQHRHTINPQHLRQIVHTSDEHVLRRVLLHLCQMSPALSGAVARGLAPHSTFARHVVNRRRNTAAATFKSEDESDDSAYERTKRRLATSSTSAKSISRPLNKPNEITPIRRESQAPASKYGIPRVKSESRPIPGPSSIDSDDQYSGAYRRSASRVASITSPGRIMLKTPTHATRGLKTSLASVRPPNAHREIPKRLTCVNCRLFFTSDSEEVCMFHTGQKVVRGGQAVYSCCNAPMNDAGCEFGCHTSTAEAQPDGSAHKRPSASPHPPGVERKRARKL